LQAARALKQQRGWLLALLAIEGVIEMKQLLALMIR